MDRSLKLPDWSKKLPALLKKYKYPALVLLLGLLLVLLPGKRTQQAAPQQIEPQSTETEAVSDDQDYRRSTEKQLAAILSKVEGAGRVEVMLTLRYGPAVSYQTDFENSSQTGDGVTTTAKQSTVILHREGAYDEAAVVKTEYPVFCGALVVSEGADDPTVRLDLMNAVAALLGLGTDKITVVKMK